MTKTVFVVRLPCGGFVGGHASLVWHKWRKPVDFAHARVFLKRQGASGIAQETGGEILACDVTLTPSGAPISEET